MYYTYVMGMDTGIFNLEKHGFKRYEFQGYVNDEVLHLCEQLCNCKFESIKKMLSDNLFYSTIIK